MPLTPGRAGIGHLCLERAEALREWGRRLSSRGEPTRALEKFDAAIDVYRTCGYGERFIDRILADRNRASLLSENV